MFVDRLINSNHEVALIDTNSKTFRNIESGVDVTRTVVMRKLYVLKSKRGQVRLCQNIDNTIYDSNRNLRLVLSNKFKAQLKRFCYPFNGFTNFRDERPTVDFAYFQSTLISFSPPEVVKLNMITINADDHMEVAMDIDNVQLEVKNDVCVAPVPERRCRVDALQLEVKNDECVAPVRVRRSRLVALTNDRRKINLRFPQLLNFFESYVI